MLITLICSYLVFSESSLKFLLLIWCISMYFHDLSEDIVKNFIFTLLLCKDMNIINI